MSKLERFGYDSLAGITVNGIPATSIQNPAPTPTNSDAK